MMLRQNTTATLLKNADSHQNTAELSWISSYSCSPPSFQFAVLKALILGRFALHFICVQGRHVAHEHGCSERFVCWCAQQIMSDIVCIKKFQHLLPPNVLKNEVISLCHLTHLVWVTEPCNESVLILKFMAFSGALKLQQWTNFSFVSSNITVENANKHLGTKCKVFNLKWLYWHLNFHKLCVFC